MEQNGVCCYAVGYRPAAAIRTNDLLTSDGCNAYYTRYKYYTGNSLNNVLYVLEKVYYSDNVHLFSEGSFTDAKLSDGAVRARRLR